MTTIATRSEEAATGRSPGRAIGLSGRLILLTMSFVMLAEILIFVPSAVSFRRSWLGDKVMGAQMVALALAATPAGSRSADVDTKLLAGLKGAQAIGVRGPGTRWILAVAGDEPPQVTREIDLRRPSWWKAATGFARTLVAIPSPAVRIIADGVPGIVGVEWVELVVDEAPLKDATLAFTRDFALVSLLISALTGALLYLALHLMVVRPVRRLSANIADFAAHPEDATRVIRPSGRADELGRAEEALARMETTLSAELRSKRHLADLGLAVSKINHELRNMLTTAQLLGDRLGEVEDPAVRRIAPRLVRTLARAIDFCGATLAYGRATERPPRREPVPLRQLVEDQRDLAAVADAVPIAIDVRDVPHDLTVDADAEQLSRIMHNLIRNAVEALTLSRTDGARIWVSAEHRGGAVRIRIADNGPGVPARSRDRLFSAFQASERTGGTGLGLPVADELARLHGGSLELEQTEHGASFLIVIPDTMASRAGPRRQAAAE